MLNDNSCKFQFVFYQKMYVFCSKFHQKHWKCVQIVMGITAS